MQGFCWSLLVRGFTKLFFFLLGEGVCNLWPEGFDLPNTYERFVKYLTLRKVLPTFIQSGLSVFYVLATELGAGERVLHENRHESCHQDRSRDIY